jgi:hypothetical protein
LLKASKIRDWISVSIFALYLKMRFLEAAWDELQARQNCCSPIARLELFIRSRFDEQ